MAVTVRDLAKKCNLSLGTVSNVLNSRATVTAAVRAQVELAIAELGYVPHQRRRMTRHARPTLAFLLGNRELLDPFHSRILEGVSRKCEDVDALVVFSKLQYSADVEAARLQLPAALRSPTLIDCVVLAGVHYPNIVARLQSMHVPHVVLANNFVGGESRVVDQVRFDDFAAARDATEYLIEMGHRHIWFIGDTSFPWFDNRYRGYSAAMRRAELPTRARTAAISDDRFVNGFRCTASIFDSGEPMTAIFTGTDEVAYGCWEYLQQRSVRVPDDVSLLGFDDQRGPYKGVGLSTVRVEAESIGTHLAVMAIEKSLASPGRALPEIIVPTRLIKRGTCQPTRSSGPATRPRKKSAASRA